MTATAVGAPAVSGPQLRRSDLCWLLAGPICLALAGATHPSPLTPDNAAYWRTLHVVLLPLFPLLALQVWVLLRGVRGGLVGVLAWGARVLSLVYAAFYSALDVLAGIANGVVLSAAAGRDVDWVKGALFAEAGWLGEVGEYALLVALVLLAAVYLRAVGWASLPGSLVLVAAAWSFRDSHVYPVRGVLTMLAFGVGAVLLALPLLARQRQR